MASEGRANLQHAVRRALLRFGVEPFQDRARCRSLLADLAADPIIDPSADIELLVAACPLAGAATQPEQLRNALADTGLGPDDAVWVTDSWRPILDAMAALDPEPPTLVEDDTNPHPDPDLATGGAGTYTFVFTDIEGSTRHWDRSAEKMRAALALHDELLHEAVGGNGGRVFKHTGDGVCAVFASPAAAVAAAVEAQISFRHAPWSIEGGLRIRIGIHSGEATTRGDDYLGPALNRVGRLHAVAHGGQVIVSAATELLVRNALSPPFELRYLGEHRLRDLPDPQPIFQATHPELQLDFDDLRTESSSVSNLPLELTSFLGRDDDIANIEDRLARSRLVTLTGAGGVGKTRLSLQVGARVADRFSEGVRFCELAPIDSASDVFGAIMTTLDVPPASGQTNAERLVDWMKSRHLLLMLDNCEHVLDAARSLVASVIGNCPAVTVLATSREALSVDGEHIWPVRPLALPPPDATANDARLFDAVALFEERAQGVRPDFDITDGNVAEVLRICERLDGVPLAIELAAARVRSMSPSEIFGHLDARFRLLGGRAVAKRQTLLGTVDWSYDLLDEGQRLLFNRLAFFQDGFSLEAARIVGVGVGVDEWDVIDIVDELVDKSMLIAELGPEAARYRMLETMREYGMAKANEAGEADEIRARLGRWALHYCETWGPKALGADERIAGSNLDLELANVRSAHAAALLADEIDTAVGIVTALEGYAVIDLRYEIGRWAEQTLANPGAAEHPDRYRLLGVAAYIDWAVADYDRALSRAAEAQDLERRLERPKAWLGRQAEINSHWFRGGYEGEAASAAYLGWAIEAEEAGNEFQRGWALAQMAVATAIVSRTPANRALATEALDLARQLQSPFLQSMALYGNAEWLIDSDPNAALDLLRQGVEVGRHSNRFSYGICLSALAALQGRVGDPSEALALYRDACELWHQSGNWANQWILLRNLAELLPRVGQHEFGAVLYGAVMNGPEMNPPDLSPEGQRLLVAAESMEETLGAGPYTAATSEGAKLDSSDVVALVRAELAKLAPT